MRKEIKLSIDRIRALFGPVQGRQSGALCWRSRGSEPEFLLLTTRRTGRWMIPKGGLMSGKTDAEAAEIEAWEEAGVVGSIGMRSIGAFELLKLKKGRKWAKLSVEVFPLRVESMEDEFPKSGQRQLRWFTRREAAAVVRERKLKRLILNFTPERVSGNAAGLKALQSSPA